MRNRLANRLPSCFGLHQVAQLHKASEARSVDFALGTSRIQGAFSTLSLKLLKGKGHYAGCNPLEGSSIQAHPMVPG